MRNKPAPAFVVKMIESASDADLFKKIWTEIDPDWETSQLNSTIVIEEGYGSLYRFSHILRVLIGDTEAAVWQVNNKGYFATPLEGFNEAGKKKVAFYYPAPTPWQKYATIRLCDGITEINGRSYAKGDLLFLARTRCQIIL